MGADAAARRSSDPAAGLRPYEICVPQGLRLPLAGFPALGGGSQLLRSELFSSAPSGANSLLKKGIASLRVAPPFFNGLLSPPPGSGDCQRHPGLLKVDEKGSTVRREAGAGEF